MLRQGSTGRIMYRTPTSRQTQHVVDPDSDKKEALEKNGYMPALVSFNDAVRDAQWHDAEEAS